MSDVTRLSRNFHCSFKPERQYINGMLRFAASGSEGDARAIAASTGIPMGKSTGKVPAILDYCRGMGLIRISGKKRSSKKAPELTPFGRSVLLEDPFLKTEVSQWIAHLNLCSPKFGADVWYQVFFRGAHSLGMTFDRSELESYLSLVYGIEKSGLIGPFVGMYQDEAAFGICRALAESGSTINRNPAPLNDEYGYAYGAWLLQLFSDNFPEQGQISTTELDAQAGFRKIPGWDVGSYQCVLALVEKKGLIEVDRHMEPWLLRPKTTAESAWNRIYNDLL